MRLPKNHNSHIMMFLGAFTPPYGYVSFAHCLNQSIASVWAAWTGSTQDEDPVYSEYQ